MKNLITFIFCLISFICFGQTDHTISTGGTGTTPLSQTQICALPTTTGGTYSNKMLQGDSTCAGGVKTITVRDWLSYYLAITTTHLATTQNYTFAPSGTFVITSPVKLTSGAAAGYVETSDATGNATWTAPRTKTLVYTVGSAGNSANYNFTAPNNMTQQSIQLGATTIIPANSPVLNIVVKVTYDLAGTSDSLRIGTTSGNYNYLAHTAFDIGGVNSMVLSQNPYNIVNSAASSVYFSMKPTGTTWDSFGDVVWKIWITYLDNSTN
jgi:hypothetical protein